MLHNKTKQNRKTLMGVKTTTETDRTMYRLANSWSHTTVHSNKNVLKYITVYSTEFKKISLEVKTVQRRSF